MQKNKEKITTVQIRPILRSARKTKQASIITFYLMRLAASQLHCHVDELKMIIERSKKSKEVLIFRDFLDGVARCHKQFYLLFQGAGVEWKKSAERFQFVIIIVHS